MADAAGQPVTGSHRIPSINEARVLARERFKSRLLAGEQVGGCDCHDERPAMPAPGGPVDRLAGVRFRDSGQIYWFQASDIALQPGDWVLVETNRGREAGRVVIAPEQMSRRSLQGELTGIVRKMSADDIARMDSQKTASARAVKQCAAIARELHPGTKVIVANFSFDGQLLVVQYSRSDRERRLDDRQLDHLAWTIAAEFRCRVELHEVGPRDEARLLGGLGRCGRTLCCSSWLPVFPDISMNMVKTQDLPLNPSKVSGVCGRLLCCLSYENEQYKKMKILMPKLGQTVETGSGTGIVVAMQLLKELVTVRLNADGKELILNAAELDMNAVDAGDTVPVMMVVPPAPVPAPVRPVPALSGNELKTEETNVDLEIRGARSGPESPAAAPRGGRRRGRRRPSRNS